MLSFWSKTCDALRSFRRAREGNVAIIFALAVIPIIGFVGCAIDYSRANAVKAGLQTALDSTALMLAKQAANLSNDQLQTDAKAFLLANFDHPDAKDITVSATYASQGGSTVTVNGSLNVPTEFMQIFGVYQINVGTSSTAKWGTTRLRVALVLDNTGSMADDGKIDALKTATANLLTQLKDAVTNDGDVYVSIIPFVKDVNVGAGNYNANWIYWGTVSGSNAQDPTKSDNTSWDANNGSCNRGSSFSTRSACLTYPVCSKSQYTTKSQCQSKSGTWYSTAGTWTPKNHDTWNGCVMDRGYPASPSKLGGNSGPDTGYNYDTNAEAPDPNTPRWSSLYPAEQYSSCPQAAVGLSYDWTAMNTLVNNMSPAGNTNQAIGLQLGWMSLAGGGPFTVPAMDPNYQYQQIIIMLTDGLNTQDRWYTNASSIDARQQQTCNNIKAAGITLYAIQVDTGGDPTSTLLQNCASTSDKFFLLTSANQIVATFQQIGTDITKLRVAQ